MGDERPDPVQCGAGDEGEGNRVSVKEEKMRTCENCINHNVSKQRECNTMNEAPADLFCWADKKMQLEREHACLAYSIKMGATDAVVKCIARINSLKRRADRE